jgi:hypothetical protein
MQSILSGDDTASLSVSESPELKYANGTCDLSSNKAELNMDRTPVEGRVQLSADIIQRIATAAGPTPTTSTLAKHKVTNCSFEPCILCGKIIKANDQEHFTYCFSNVKDKSIIESLESAQNCYFCKSGWIAKNVSRTFKINHMKSCAESCIDLAKHLKSLKCENNPDTPIIAEDNNRAIDS